MAAVVGLALAAALLAQRLFADDGAAEAADGFAKAWSAGDDRAAAGFTDAPGPAAATLRGNRAGLDGAKVTVEAGEPDSDGDRATVAYAVRWSVPAIGRFGYRTRAVVVKRGDDWKLRWRPTLVHPQLERGVRLGTVREPRRRGAIQGRDGKPLMTGRPVQRVGAVAGKVRDPRATARGLAAAVDVDAAPLERAIRRGGEQQFVEAVALRDDDFARVEAAVKRVPGAAVVAGTAQLAPTRAFGRALLGRRRPGYRRAAREAGRPLRRRRRGRPVGPPAALPAPPGPHPGPPDRAPRRTACRSTRWCGGRAATGARCAPRSTSAPRRPPRPRSAGAGTRPRWWRSNRRPATSWRWPTGRSTPPTTARWRATTRRARPSRWSRTAALLADGLTPSETVDCPRDHRLSTGARSRTSRAARVARVPFARDFAQSCNTAFVSLADRARAPTH